MNLTSSFRSNTSKKTDLNAKGFSSLSSINPPNGQSCNFSHNNIQSLLNSPSNQLFTNLDLSNNSIEIINEDIDMMNQ